MQSTYRLTAHDRKYLKRARYRRQRIKRILKDFKTALPSFRKRRSFSAIKQRLLSSQQNLDAGFNVQLLDFLTRRQSFRAATTRRGSLLFSVCGLRKSNKHFSPANSVSVKKVHAFSQLSSFPSSFVTSRFALDKISSSTITNGVLLSNNLQQKLVETASSFSSFADEFSNVNPISF